MYDGKLECYMNFLFTAKLNLYLIEILILILLNFCYNYAFLKPQESSYTQAG